MEQHHADQIEKIIKDMNCPKNFVCYKSGFENLCSTRDIGLESFIKCLEENPGECIFSLSFGYSYLCTCPLRIYILRNMKK